MQLKDRLLVFFAVVAIAISLFAGAVAIVDPSPIRPAAALRPPVASISAPVVIGS